MRTFLYAATVMLMALTNAAAQTVPKTLNLEDCIRMAQDAPSSVTVARHESEIARYGLVQARAGLLPQVHFGSVYTYNSPQPGNPENFSFVALNGIREYNSMFTTFMEVDTSGKLRAALAQARAPRMSLRPISELLGAI